jgi:hypothetical protein
MGDPHLRRNSFVNDRFLMRDALEDLLGEFVMSLADETVGVDLAVQWCGDLLL